jgi:hypothetical protein
MARNIMPRDQRRVNTIHAVLRDDELAQLDEIRASLGVEVGRSAALRHAIKLAHEALCSESVES